MLALAFLLNPVPIHASDGEDPGTVLILAHSPTQMEALQLFNKGFLAGLNASSERKISFFYEFTGLNRFSDREHIIALRDLFKARYADRKIDVIIGAGTLTADFLYEFGEELFPKTPSIWVTIGPKAAERAKKVPNSIITMGNIALERSLATILAIQPDTRQIALVAGSTDVDRGRFDLARKAIADTGADLELIDLSGMSYESLLTRIIGLPERTVVLYLSFYADSTGKVFDTFGTLSKVSKASSRPVYSLMDLDLQYGSVGGYLLSFEELGVKAGEQAIMVLAGRSPEQIPVNVAGGNQLMFDWRQLKRWGIDENRLPPGSVVLNREPSLWSMYGHYVIIGLAVLLVQSILILLLLVNRARLQRAEEAQRRTNLELDDRLRFESLFSNTSNHFINIPHGMIEKEVRRVLEEMGMHFEVDRCVFLYLPHIDGEQPRSYVWLRDTFPTEWARIPHDSLEKHVDDLRSLGTLKFSRIEEMPEGYEPLRDYIEEIGIRSHLWVQIVVDEKILGRISLSTLSEEKEWTEKTETRIQAVGGLLTNALLRAGAEASLHTAITEIRELKQQLQLENIYLREETGIRVGSDGIVGSSDGIGNVLDLIEKVAPTESNVLITGETGTGKELVAKELHRLSPRKDRIMVTVNCAAILPTLIESEMFGREKGAYTGALSSQAGRFEVADGSTIFLDEIGELSPEVQAKLLRVIQEGEFERLGSPRTIRVNTRVLASTNRDLEKAVEEGAFREDLYYRLNVFPIHVPPLRQRVEDIPALAWAFVREFESTMNKRIDVIPESEMNRLLAHPWPGNVRELRNIVERSMILAKGTALHLPVPVIKNGDIPEKLKLDDVNRGHILAVLERTGWRVHGKGGAADLLGINPSTLRSRMEKLNIVKP